MYPKIKKEIESLDLSLIPKERKELLEGLAEYIQLKKDKGKPILLNFICTHNSRRSHLGQVWAAAMADYFKIEKVYTYSGGTEATAIFPTIVETLKDKGFSVFKLSQDNNPIYAIKTEENNTPIIGFSKKYDSEFNPQSDFCAIMTCSSANEACPLVIGSEKRIAITYEDPKAYDNTPQQAEKYEERSRQIATELKYVFSRIK